MIYLFLVLTLLGLYFSNTHLRIQFRPFSCRILLTLLTFLSNFFYTHLGIEFLFRYYLRNLILRIFNLLLPYLFFVNLILTSRIFSLYLFDFFILLNLIVNIQELSSLFLYFIYNYGAVFIFNTRIRPCFQ
jgi:hypothetical protein